MIEDPEDAEISNAVNSVKVVRHFLEFGYSRGG
jgi:hypothetical protein